MKRTLSLFLLLFVLCSCQSGENSGAVPMSELFTISTYVYDEATDSYNMSPLQLNEVRQLPLHCADGANYHLLLRYESGMCQVIAENRDVQLSVGFWPLGDLGEDRFYGYDLTVAGEEYMALLPFSSWGYTHFSNDSDGLMKRRTFRGHIGCEFYLTVNALDSVGSAIATARLKIVQLEDPGEKDDNRSGKFSIEMISYEYSDMYKMMEGAS